jgi:protein-S-isoprenylcysteine O-methyltransferase Ste14
VSEPDPQPESSARPVPHGVASLWAALPRWRVPLGFALGPAVLWLATPTPRTLAAGALVACAGEALRFWAAGHLIKSRELTSSGPYRWIAHPLYVGSAVMGVGLATAAASTAATALILAYLATTLPAAIRSEERFLRHRFGDRDVRYRTSPAGPGARRFELTRAIRNREHRALIGLVLILAVLALKALWWAGE